MSDKEGTIIAWHSHNQGAYGEQGIMGADWGWCVCADSIKDGEEMQRIEELQLGESVSDFSCRNIESVSTVSGFT